MSNIPQELRYAKTHEWVQLTGSTIRIGITDHAQCELGDLVFAEAKPAGTPVKPGQVIGSVESVKTASDLYSPADGVIAASNASLADQPEQINTDPYGCWFVEIELTAAAWPANLMTADEYKTFIGE
ncbi:MAG: glycine cleavage system protein GcvH [Eubacteriales bacterium]|nr:glycine cleavage system protein GcvH [Eubacteriales bacterium]